MIRRSGLAAIFWLASFASVFFVFTVCFVSTANILDVLGTTDLIRYSGQYHLTLFRTPLRDEFILASIAFFFVLMAAARLHSRDNSVELSDTASPLWHTAVLPATFAVVFYHPLFMMLSDTRSLTDTMIRFTSLLIFFICLQQAGKLVAGGVDVFPRYVRAHPLGFTALYFASVAVSALVELESMASLF